MAFAETTEIKSDIDVRYLPVITAISNKHKAYNNLRSAHNLLHSQLLDEIITIHKLGNDRDTYWKKCTDLIAFHCTTCHLCRQVTPWFLSHSHSVVAMVPM
jgi:hypothetical protein